MAVGETCVDAERARRFGERGVAWRQRKTGDNRSIARPLVSDDNRGAGATHGGIGLGDVHCCGQELACLKLMHRFISGPLKLGPVCVCGV